MADATVRVVMVYMRWLCLVPAALLAWYAALVIGLLAHSGLDRLCPPALMVSGWCTAGWYRSASDAVICFGAALSAVLVLLAAAWVAPSSKTQVIWVTLATGSSVAVWLGWSASAWRELTCALAAGLLTAWLLHRRTRAPAR